MPSTSRNSPMSAAGQTTLGEINDINPARGILDGKGLMLRQNAGNHATYFDRISALRFFALQPVNFSSIDQHRQLPAFVFIFRQRRRQRFQQRQFPCRLAPAKLRGLPAVGGVGVLAKPRHPHALSSKEERARDRNYCPLPKTDAAVSVLSSRCSPPASSLINVTLPSVSAHWPFSSARKA